MNRYYKTLLLCVSLILTGCHEAKDPALPASYEIRTAKLKAVKNRELYSSQPNIRTNTNQAYINEKKQQEINSAFKAQEIVLPLEKNTDTDIVPDKSSSVPHPAKMRQIWIVDKPATVTYTKTKKIISYPDEKIFDTFEEWKDAYEKGKAGNISRELEVPVKISVPEKGHYEPRILEGEWLEIIKEYKNKKN